MTYALHIARYLTLAWLLAALAPPAIAASPADNPRESAGFRQTCANAVAAAERQNAIPDKLLTAISHAESGRWDTAEQATIAWPWTVTAEGTGHYLPSRAAAIAKVAALRARGITSIDVGCMQVNLHYHPDAFASIDAAFDPATNAAYAGGFLAALKRETGSWTAAASRYHSATPEFAVPYRARIMRLWQAARAPATAVADAGTAARTADAAATAEADADAESRRRAAAAHRKAIVAAYLARRAERLAAATPQQIATSR